MTMWQTILLSGIAVSTFVSGELKGGMLIAKVTFPEDDRYCPGAVVSPSWVLIRASCGRLLTKSSEDTVELLDVVVTSETQSISAERIQFYPEDSEVLDPRSVALVKVIEDFIYPDEYDSSILDPSNPALAQVMQDEGLMQYAEWVRNVLSASGENRFMSSMLHAMDAVSYISTKILNII